MLRDPVEEALFLDRGGFEPEPAPSHFVAMQRIIVRLLFDPAFVQEVYADPARALAGIDVAPRLVSQLLENDRRLWGADRLRRSRALKILLDEFKVSSTLALLECRRLSFLEEFFSSPPFHRAVQDRGYMAMAFSRYLEGAFQAGQLRSPHLAAALKLESAMARSRRLLREARRGRDAALRSPSAGKGTRNGGGNGAGPAGSRWTAEPGITGIFLPGGAIPLIQHIEKYLFEISQIPAVVLCEDAPQPVPLPALDENKPLAYLLEPRPGGKVDLTEIGAAFVRTIQACEKPVDAKELAAALAPHGISAEDAIDYAGQLVEGGVLRKV